MKALLVSAILVAAAPGVRAQERVLYFDAPAGVNDQDRLKAAKNLAVRCAEAGLKGVVADVHRPSPSEPKQIRLKFQDRFWSEHFPLLDFLASFQARKVEIRFHRSIRSFERIAFKEGEKAPEGFKWIQVPEWKFVAKPFPHYERQELGRFRLFAEQPKHLPGPFKVVRHPGGELFGVESDPAYLLVFKGPQAVEIDNRKVKSEVASEGHLIPMGLFIDDAYLPEGEAIMHWRFTETKGGSKPELALWKFEGLGPTTPLAGLLENPLPFELKRVKQE